MKILSVNAGSSSLKFQLFNMPEEEVLISGVFECIGLKESFYHYKINGEKTKEIKNITNHEEAIKILIDILISNKIINSLEEIEAVGHRVVHGGSTYSKSTLIDEEVIACLEKHYDLAPLHNPAGVNGIRSFMKIMPQAKGVAVFDTAFHQTMEPKDYLYATPYEWYEKYGVRKYGFHGTSHKYVSQRISEILGKEDLKTIVCHLGNGGSITAIKNGKVIDTSMGFTPLAGIVMGTRSGDIDSSIIPYIMEKTTLTINEVMDMLNKKSGLLGVSEVSSDSRDIENAYKEGNEKAKLVHEMSIKSICSYIARYFVELEGADVICFTAGIGENSIETRKDILNKLKVLGIEIDEEKNNVRGKEALITKESSKVLAYVIPTNEELMIARDTYELTRG